ncbi:hypothetical protein FQN53_007533 [Emmonsiellopsis sp. PD_33]|nr:hypothetical protein FQN53_007533 [Emmonsiellopsis sp. PD_33]
MHPHKSAKVTPNMAAAMKGTLQNVAAVKAVNRPAKRKPALRKRKATLQAVNKEDEEDEEDEDEALPLYMKSSSLSED